MEELADQPAAMAERRGQEDGRLKCRRQRQAWAGELFEAKWRRGRGGLRVAMQCINVGVYSLRIFGLTALGLWRSSASRKMEETAQRGRYEASRAWICEERGRRRCEPVQ
jgi:hypothetical protein